MRKWCVEIALCAALEQLKTKQFCCCGSNGPRSGDYFFFALREDLADATLPDAVGLLTVNRLLSTVPLGDPKPLHASQPGVES